MKILVLGSTGMAGHTISIYLHEQGHDVTTFSRRGFHPDTTKKIEIDEATITVDTLENSSDIHVKEYYINSQSASKNITGDITDFKLIESIIEKGDFDAVINCIGILNTDAEINKHKAVFLNSYLPHYLSYITKGSKTKIIHMSTDCVFSGKNGGYVETSFRDGETFYDRSKALGELENDKDLTFRNSIIGPDIDEKGIGLFNWFMKQEGQINGFTKAIWTGVTTLTLAKAMEQAIKEDLCGLYNLVNNDCISKYNLCQLFNKHLKNNGLIINESEDVNLNKTLINTRTDFSFDVPSYENMIAEMKDWIYEHKELYPHYFR